jgi:peptide/nickel transport system ATP-binding protein
VFVTHDIGVAVEVADRIAVMYAGRIVESGPCGRVVGAPLHPYTQGLLSSRAGHVFAKGSRLETIPGSPPDLAHPLPGCAFAPRCKFAMPVCTKEVPPEFVVEGGHFARCVLLAPQTDMSKSEHAVSLA